jgi:hypothetical protein
VGSLALDCLSLTKPWQVWVPIPKVSSALATALCANVSNPFLTLWATATSATKEGSGQEGREQKENMS